MTFCYKDCEELYIPIVKL